MHKIFFISLKLISYNERYITLCRYLDLRFSQNRPKNPFDINTHIHEKRITEIFWILFLLKPVDRDLMLIAVVHLSHGKKDLQIL